MQNKPNLLNAQMNVNSVLTMDYVNIRLRSRFKNKAKQTQFKPNQTQSKPKQTQFKPKYAENKPNQTQFEPNFKPIFKPVTRSRFILSGLMKCSLCNSRYQGVTRNKGKKRIDGTRVKTYYYGCGGYITKGKKVCEMNLIPKKILEDKVIDTVLDCYKAYLDKGGRKKLAEAVKKQVNFEGKELVTARQRAHIEQEKNSKIIDNLLDNITPTNREYVDRRLNKLKQQRRQLEIRLEELDQLSLSQTEIDSIVTDSMQFLSSLEFTLRQGLPHEKLAALRQCIEKIQINKPAGEIKLAIRMVPGGNLRATQEFRTPV